MLQLPIAMKNKSAVYIIICEPTQKSYIGSSKDVRKRIRSHWGLLRNGKHTNTHIQRAFNMYGEENFIVEILEFCEESLLQDREQFFLNQFKPEFNIAKDTKAPMRYRKHSPETLVKLQGREPWNRGILRTEKEIENIKEGFKNFWDNATPEYHAWRCDISKNMNHGRYWLGKKVPAHVEKQIIEYGKSIRQKVKCINNGKIYDSQLDAAKDLGIRQGHIAEMLAGTRNSASGFFFQRINV